MASQLDYLNGAPVVRSIIEGRPRVMLVNTGSSVSLIQPGVSASKLNRSDCDARRGNRQWTPSEGWPRSDLHCKRRGVRARVLCVYYSHRGWRDSMNGFPEESGSLCRFWKQGVTFLENCGNRPQPSGEWVLWSTWDYRACCSHCILSYRRW